MSEVQITYLEPKWMDAYERFLVEVPYSLLYHSNKYRLFLMDILKDAEDKYILAVVEDKIVGALPSFLKKNKQHGSVLNSLPFYGSHGGVLLHPELAEPEVASQLLSEFNALAIRESVLTSTLISNPFSPNFSSLDSFSTDLTDTRIGQYIDISAGGSEPPPNEKLMASFHSKTRNMVRKALKAGISCSIDSSESAWEYLIETHKKNIIDIGGIYKNREIFNAIRARFKKGKDYDIWVAKYEDKIVAALLLFYFNKTVEYFTPCVSAEYRSLQPLSAIIYSAICECATNGFRYWNWGGTWTTQEGVHLFKSRWGTCDKEYKYHINVHDPKVYTYKADTLSTNYPYFYVIPYKELKS